MTDDTKPDDEVDDDDTDDDDGKGTKTKTAPSKRAGRTGTAGARRREQDKARLRPVVEELLDELLGDDEDDDEDDADDAPKTKGKPRSARDVEDVSKDKVRAAVEELAAETKLRDDVAELKKKVVEVPPAKVNRLQRFLWGDK